MSQSACISACGPQCNARYGPLKLRARSRCKDQCEAACLQEVAQYEEDVANAQLQAQIDQFEADQKLKEKIVGLIKWVLVLAVVGVVIYFFLKHRKQLGLDKLGQGIKEIVT